MLSHFIWSNSLRPCELQFTRLLYPWDFTGKNPGVGCHALLQGIFQTQELNLHLQLLHCMWIFYHWATGEPQPDLYSSVQFSRSVVSNSLRTHESQHARPPCPSPTPGVHPDSHPSSQWCHPAISFFVVPFSSCPQSLPASGSFTMSQLFSRGGQSIEVSALASVLPKNTKDWSLEWSGWISLQASSKSLVNLSEV